MLDKLYEAFVKDPERMMFKFSFTIFSLFAGGFCLLGVAAIVFVLKP
jgi:hypothetical protein